MLGIWLTAAFSHASVIIVGGGLSEISHFGELDPLDSKGVYTTSIELYVPPTNSFARFSLGATVLFGTSLEIIDADPDELIEVSLELGFEEDVTEFSEIDYVPRTRHFANPVGPGWSSDELSDFKVDLANSRLTWVTRTPASALAGYMIYGERFNFGLPTREGDDAYSIVMGDWTVNSARISISSVGGTAVFATTVPEPCSAIICMIVGCLVTGPSNKWIRRRTRRPVGVR